MDFKVGDWVRVREHNGNESIVRFSPNQAFVDGWYQQVELWESTPHHEAELKQAYIDGLNSYHDAITGLIKRRMEQRGTTHEERCVLQEIYESIGGTE